MARTTMIEIQQAQELEGDVRFEVGLSVVIPSHNRKGLLHEVLLALAEQTYPMDQFEVVVVVDGSEDGTMDMLHDLDVPYSLRFSWQRQGGPARARNAGIDQATGTTILFLDDDVVPDPHLLEEHISLHDRDENAVVLGRVSPPVDMKLPGWSRWEEQLLSRHFKALAEKRRKVVGRHLYSHNCSVRKKHLLSVGGFDEKMTRAEDIDLGYRLEHLGLHFYFNSKANGVHRGFHSFEGWRDISYQYGRLDVIMGRDKGYPGMLAEILSYFRMRNPLVRLSVAICLDRKLASKLLLGLLRYVASAGDALGLSRLTRYLYSTMTNVFYWQGVSDELGGKGTLWRALERHRLMTKEGGHGLARAE